MSWNGRVFEKVVIFEFCCWAAWMLSGLIKVSTSYWFLIKARVRVCSSPKFL